MKGIDLKLRRVAARVKATDLGAAFDPPVTSSRIGHIEATEVVTDAAAEKYLKALATLTTVSAPETPAEAA